LKKIDLQVPSGQLMCVIGGTGEGKSSLLSAILGDMPCLSSRSVGSPSVVRGSIAYVAQQV
jgi:ABC-type Mn2+/Zn2+ transport system ATPase subunit